MNEAGDYMAVDLSQLVAPGLDWNGRPGVYSDCRDTELTPEQAWDVLDHDPRECVSTITIDRDAARMKDSDSSKSPHLLLKAKCRLFRRASSDRKGLHYKVELPRLITAWQALQLRKDYGDDPSRIKFDLIRAALGHPEDAGGWLADSKCYWPKGAGEFGEKWQEAGPWTEVTGSSTRGT